MAVPLPHGLSVRRPKHNPKSQISTGLLTTDVSATLSSLWPAIFVGNFPSGCGRVISLGYLHKACCLYPLPSQMLTAAQLKCYFYGHFLEREVSQLLDRGKSAFFVFWKYPATRVSSLALRTVSIGTIHVAVCITAVGPCIHLQMFLRAHCISSRSLLSQEGTVAEAVCYDWDLGPTGICSVFYHK